jgi:GNAT superfamily N-acetyltransferase
MSTDPAEHTGGALSETWRVLLAVHPNAWTAAREGVSAWATGVPIAGLNGVSCSRLDPDPDDIRSLLGELKARRLPHLLQLRPGSHPAAVAVADEEGMTPDADVPLMRLDDPAALERAGAGPPRLRIRQLGPHETTLHPRAVAAGFKAKPEHFLRLLPPPLMALDGIRAYLGEVDGQVVTTALGFTRGGSVGVFNVATPPEHRRRGYGAAVTARAAADGFAAGASWAWLQSTPAGHRVYESLGFGTLERWRCWVRS